MFKLFVFLIFSFSACASINTYQLTVTDASHHYAEVNVEFTDILDNILEVKLPVWRTGKYRILNLSANINQFQAFDESGNELTWSKTDKNTWRISATSQGSVRIRYQIYANNLRNRVSHIDTTHAFLDASGVFVYSESQRDKELTVRLNVPQNWSSISGMQMVSENTFYAPDYDVLVDSPIESGIHLYDSLEIEGKLYEIVIWGEGNFNLERLKKDISKFHHQAKNLWKTFPFERYVYIFHAGDKLSGATEHLNSTVIQVDRFGFAPEENYNKIISTTAHEFIHTWNVKSYRPSGISPYKYSKENYSDLFWVAEGTTSYYDNLFLVRSGVIKPSEFLKNLASDMEKYLNKPGRQVMSLSQSSFDSWIHPDDAQYMHNNSVNIYLKGSLVSWLLDSEIRKRTNNSKSLDDLHRTLYDHFSEKQKGYSAPDIIKELQSLTGSSFQQFWDNYVDGTQEIDFNSLLGAYGLKLDKEKSDSAKADFGMKYINEKGLVKIAMVDRGSSAWNAGLSAGDILIAINGYQLNYENVKSRIENLNLGKEYNIHYFNQGKLLTTVIKPGKTTEKLKIIAVKTPTRKQKQLFENWTGKALDTVNEK